MKYFAALLCFAPMVSNAQAANDLVKIWLSQNSIQAMDYQTCDPAEIVAVVGTDGLCKWGSDLGARPTSAQLQALIPAWQAQHNNTQSAAIVQGQYQALIISGLAITSTSTPSLNDTYGIDDATETHINSELSSIAVNGTFTNGQITKAWPNLNQTAAHTFTIAQFKTLVTAIGQYKDALVETKITLANGGSASWPTISATIP